MEDSTIKLVPIYDEDDGAVWVYDAFTEDLVYRIDEGGSEDHIKQAALEFLDRRDGTNYTQAYHLLSSAIMAARVMVG